MGLSLYNIIKIFELHLPPPLFFFKKGFRYGEPKTVKWINQTGDWKDKQRQTNLRATEHQQHKGLHNRSGWNLGPLCEGWRSKSDEGQGKRRYTINGSEHWGCLFFTRFLVLATICVIQVCVLPVEAGCLWGSRRQKQSAAGLWEWRLSWRWSLSGFYRLSLVHW